MPTKEKRKGKTRTRDSERKVETSHGEKRGANKTEPRGGIRGKAERSMGKYGGERGKKCRKGGEGGRV